MTQVAEAMFACAKVQPGHRHTVANNMSVVAMVYRFIKKIGIWLQTDMSVTAMVYRIIETCKRLAFAIKVQCLLTISCSSYCCEAITAFDH